ncbi:MAG: hypothetical protein LBJ88_06020 [Campylobacteraceae bacterium]|jgi:hypothetical protein|nr:hypothetical protein [Campylobacteraceae bacterium]
MTKSGKKLSKNTAQSAQANQIEDVLHVKTHLKKEKQDISGNIQNVVLIIITALTAAAVLSYNVFFNQ